MSKIDKQQFDAIAVGDKIKSPKTGNFEAVKEKHEKVVVIESGYVMERSDLTTDDLQAVQHLSAEAYSYNRNPYSTKAETNSKP